MSSARTTNPRRRALLALAGGAAIAAASAILFCRLYVGAEDGSYFWDWVAYFHAFQATAANLRADPLPTCAAILRSVREADYNLAVVTPLLPIAAIFGTSRAVYVCAVAVLYLVPTACLAACLARRTGERLAPLPLFAAALLYWPIWMATLRGMPDIAGLIPLGAATLLALRTRFLTKAGLRAAIAFGLLVWGAFLIRRWYAYACASLEALTFVFALVELSRGGMDLAAIRRFGERYAVNILALLAALFVMQGPLARRILATNYADVYAAYQQPLASTVALVLHQLGFLAACAIAAGGIRAILRRDETVLFTLLLALLSGGLFLHVQAPGLHHVLPFYFWLFPALVYGLAWPWSALGRAAPLGKAASVAGLAAASFAAMYLPGAGAWPVARLGLLPTAGVPPLRVERPAAYAELIRALSALSANRAIAVFASSPALNPSRLGAMDTQLRQRLVPVSEVDRRDGFYMPAFAADVAVVTSAPATHLVPSGQRVVTLPAHWIFASEGPGRAYTRRAGPFQLDDGLDAYIYVRERPLSEDDMVQVENQLRAIYPDWVMTKDGPGPM